MCSARGGGAAPSAMSSLSTGGCLGGSSNTQPSPSTVGPPPPPPKPVGYDGAPLKPPPPPPAPPWPPPPPSRCRLRPPRRMRRAPRRSAVSVCPVRWSSAAASAPNERSSHCGRACARGGERQRIARRIARNCAGGAHRLVGERQRVAVAAVVRAAARALELLARRVVAVAVLLERRPHRPPLRDVGRLGAEAAAHDELLVVQRGEVGERVGGSGAVMGLRWSDGAERSRRCRGGPFK